MDVLRDRRFRLLSPHRLAGVFSSWLVEVASLFDALGVSTGDQRWHSVATSLDKAAVELRALL